jgi:hypothetical protein
MHPGGVAVRRCGGAGRNGMLQDTHFYAEGNRFDGTASLRATDSVQARHWDKHKRGFDCRQLDGPVQLGRVGAHRSSSRGSMTVAAASAAAAALALSISASISTDCGSSPARRGPGAPQWIAAAASQPPLRRAGDGAHATSPVPP